LNVDVAVVPICIAAPVIAECPVATLESKTTFSATILPVDILIAPPFGPFGVRVELILALANFKFFKVKV